MGLQCSRGRLWGALGVGGNISATPTHLIPSPPCCPSTALLSTPAAGQTVVLPAGRCVLVPPLLPPVPLYHHQPCYLPLRCLSSPSLPPACQVEELQQMVVKFEPLAYKNMQLRFTRVRQWFWVVVVIGEHSCRSWEDSNRPAPCPRLYS